MEKRGSSEIFAIWFFIARATCLACSPGLANTVAEILRTTLAGIVVCLYQRRSDLTCWWLLWSDTSDSASSILSSFLWNAQSASAVMVCGLGVDAKSCEILRLFRDSLDMFSGPTPIILVEEDLWCVEGPRRWLWPGADVAVSWFTYLTFRHSKTSRSVWRNVMAIMNRHEACMRYNYDNHQQICHWMCMNICSPLLPRLPWPLYPSLLREASYPTAV